MKIDLNKTISFIIIIVGHLFFLLNVSSNYPLAFIAIISMMILWMIWSKITKLFSLDFLLYLILLSGSITSISILMTHGIEQVGTRHGNLIDLHLSPIAIALGILFISSLPYIIFNLKFDIPVKKFNIQLKPTFQKSSNKKIDSQPHYIIDSDEWEIASEQDFQSY